VAGVSSSSTAREQQGLVQTLLIQRLHAQPLGVRGERGVARLAALVERHDAGPHRKRQQQRQRRKERAQAAVRPPLLLALLLRLGSARLASRKPRSSVFRSRSWPAAQSSAAARRAPRYKLAAVAVRGLPVARGVRQVLVQAASLGVLLEPRAQPRPLAQQRLVRQLERVIVHGHEPAVDQHGRAAAVCSSSSSSSSGTGRRTNAASCSPASASRSRIRRAASRSSALSRVQVHSARRPTAPRTPAGALIDREAHRIALALAPLLEQSGRQHRQPAGLLEHVGDQRLGQRGLDAQADPAGGLLDRPAQLVGLHRATNTWSGPITARTARARHSVRGSRRASQPPPGRAGARAGAGTPAPGTPST
jgi:hypothetical protein